MSGHTTNLFRAVLPLLILGFACAVHAEVRLPAIISDNLVLQQGTKVRIWGSARAGERVTVTFQNKSAEAVADSQGHWQVFVGPLKRGGPAELTVKGDNTLTIKNVLVGEVWLCSGQSNMEWPLANTIGATETLAQANYPEIRMFRVEHHTSAEPLTDLEGHWVVTTPDEAAHF